jgi:hypothetical protein
MDKSALSDRLTKIEEYLSTGQLLISRQRKLVIDLMRNNADITDSMELIQYLDQIQFEFYAERVRLRKELAE